MTPLEKQVHNIDLALRAVVSICLPYLPEDKANQIDNLMQAYHQTNKELRVPDKNEFLGAEHVS